MRSLYFDYNATTPIAEEVLEVLHRALREGYGNASSIHHLGQASKQSLETARRQVSELLGCSMKEIVFGSGGTEADNHAIFGVCRFRERPHVITSEIEHPAVLNAVAEVERRGGETTVVPVSGAGVVDPEEVRRALRPNTALISVMHVNNEIGTVQPIAEIAASRAKPGILLHSTACRRLGEFR